MEHDLKLIKKTQGLQEKACKLCLRIKGKEMADDKKLLCDRIFDLYKRAERDCVAQFSNFLDGAEQVTVMKNCFMSGFNTQFYGGFPDAERKIFGVFPEWEEPGRFPLKVIEITHNFGGELSHRDYLGSVLGLGIDRSKTGDILIEENSAFVYVTEQIADFIADNLKKIGSRGVKVSLKSIEDIKLPEKKFIEIPAVCASLRLDAVVGAAANIARAKACALISGGLVKLNHIEQEKAATPVLEGDLLSIRGYGRFILLKTGNETRKGRIHIVLKKYV